MINTSEACPPTSAIEIQRFEQRRCMTLPSDYKKFLLLRNGGRPERDLFFVPESETNPIVRIHFFFGLGDPDEVCDLDWVLDVVADRIQRDFLPIARTEGNDKICLEVAGRHPGQILFWDGHIFKGENVYPVAKSFTEFIKDLFRDENSPKLHIIS